MTNVAVNADRVHRAHRVHAWVWREVPSAGLQARVRRNFNGSGDFFRGQSPWNLSKTLRTTELSYKLRRNCDERSNYGTAKFEKILRKQRFTKFDVIRCEVIRKCLNYLKKKLFIKVCLTSHVFYFYINLIFTLLQTHSWVLNCHVSATNRDNHRLWERVKLFCTQNEVYVYPHSLHSCRWTRETGFLEGEEEEDLDKIAITRDAPGTRWRA